MYIAIEIATQPVQLPQNEGNKQQRRRRQQKNIYAYISEILTHNDTYVHSSSNKQH